MKHILKFIGQTIVVVFVLTPFFIVRFIWTFQWSDKIGTSTGEDRIYTLYKRSYRSMVNKIKGRKWSYM
jgi:hypothetical protein